MKPGDLLYDVDENGNVVAYEFIREAVAPGARVPSWAVRRKGETGTVNVSVDYLCKSKVEALHRDMNKRIEGAMAYAQWLAKAQQSHTDAIARMSQSINTYLQEIASHE